MFTFVTHLKFANYNCKKYVHNGLKRNVLITYV